MRVSFKIRDNQQPRQKSVCRALTRVDAEILQQRRTMQVGVQQETFTERAVWRTNCHAGTQTGQKAEGVCIQDFNKRSRRFYIYSPSLNMHVYISDLPPKQVKPCFNVTAPSPDRTSTLHWQGHHISKQTSVFLSKETIKAAVSDGNLLAIIYKSETGLISQDTYFRDTWHFTRGNNSL